MAASLRRLARAGLSKGVAWINQNPWTDYMIAFVPRDAYQHDGLRTVHSHVFLNRPDFQRAYARAVRASGWDYKMYWRIHVLLWAASNAARVPGAFVECGTGRGFIASAICEHLSWTDRPFYLFDTFEPGLVTPDTLERGDEVAFYADGAERVRENFREWPGVDVIGGEVPSSLTTVDIDRVAFLSVDMNNPVPEEAAIRHFWPRLSLGGMVVLDDYAYRGYDRARESADRLGAELGFSVLSLPTGQGLILKSG